MAARSHLSGHISSTRRLRYLDNVSDINSLKRLHEKINHCIPMDTTLSINLMRAYAFFGDPATARRLFDETPDKNIVFYNVLIRGYVRNHFYFDALLLFREMAPRPDNYTFPCVLKACSASSDLAMGSQVHAIVTRVGLGLNLFVGNGLVSLYGKCNRHGEARQVFEEMPVKDVSSWNSLVSAYAQTGQLEKALGVCEEMELADVQLDSCTMASFLPAATASSSPDKVPFIEALFSKLQKKSLVSCNVMIAVYARNAMPEAAVGVYSSMAGEGIEPDAITIATLLPVVGALSALWLGRRLHDHVKRKRLRPNMVLENALIDMYSNCGSVSDAMDVFSTMDAKDVASWTSLISGYGMLGQGRKAIALFEEMLESGLNPDSIIFVSTISACSHAGLLEEGRHYFDLMDAYKIAPNVDHFACMVDLLGRAGLVDEAYELIKGMPMEPNERIWGSLLAACRVHTSIAVGLLAGDNLLRLVPEESGYYVLLSNVYAGVGKWKEVRSIREAMRGRRVKKTPGVSSFEIEDGRVHSFLSGDQYHPQSGEIYRGLEVLKGKLKEVGYVPDRDSVLHDIEEEEKEEHLAVHSEKLAIVFAVLNTEPGSAVRITKNLRICGDCHAAAKLISRIEGREIMVRDNTRFHHFHSGTCSCCDYW